jgi:hypothetical protein
MSSLRLDSVGVKDDVGLLDAGWDGERENWEEENTLVWFT